MPIRNNSIARARLAKALAPAPAVMSQADLAVRLGVSQQAVSSWVHGVTMPLPKYMAAIQRLLGIPMTEWTETNVPLAPESAPALRKTARRARKVA